MFGPEDFVCQHEYFAATVDVHRLINPETGELEHYQADVQIRCSQCRLPFRFLGLPAGVDLNGAAVSVGGEEARLAILPRGQVLNIIEGAPQGFTVKRA